jgi:porphobilinogen deaminase
MIRVGSRESKLAVIQSNLMIEEIKKFYPNEECSLITMKTTGDKILDKSLDKIGGKGLFIKELDNSILSGNTDVSVHSLKDMQMEADSQFPILAYSKREDARDVLILRNNLKELPQNPIIGTSSSRRTLQVVKLFPTAKIKMIRGNVITRLEKLDSGEFDAIILAAAGLKRLGLEHRISKYFSVEEILPAAGQGIMVLQGRNDKTLDFLKNIDNKEARTAAEAERSFIRTLGGGCSLPTAAYAWIENIEAKGIAKLHIKGLYYDVNTKKYMYGYDVGLVEEAKLLGERLAMYLRNKLIGKNAYIVGAGPGAKELLTIKAKELIETADVIIYDALISEEIFSTFKTGIELIYVGKRAGNHAMPQDDINRVIWEKANLGLKVVRLKGGDPFIFGRGAEETEYLYKKGMPFEVVPAISSAMAVPTYAGIPLTHRNISASVQIVTGHGKNNEEPNISYKLLAESKGTLVFLMGLKSLENICHNLIINGMSKDMPVAVIENGTLSRQRVEIGTLENIAKINKLQPPAIIVVGQVCELRNVNNWFGKMPLFGKEVIVTRPKIGESILKYKLKSAGASVIELPAIELEHIENSDIIVKLLKISDDRGDLSNKIYDDNLCNVIKYNWLVFTSPSGVNFFIKELIMKNFDIRNLSGIKIAVVGKSTAKALMNYGIIADLVPEVFSARELGLKLVSAVKENEEILIVKAENGSEDLEEILTKNAVIFDEVVVYKTKIKEKNDVLEYFTEYLENGEKYITFASASAVKGFVEQFSSVDKKNLKAVCIGDQTAKEAINQGFDKIVVSKEASFDSMIDSLIDL